MPCNGKASHLAGDPLAEAVEVAAALKKTSKPAPALDMKASGRFHRNQSPGGDTGGRLEVLKCASCLTYFLLVDLLCKGKGRPQQSGH